MTAVGRDLLERNCVWNNLMGVLMDDQAVVQAEGDFAAGDVLLSHAGAALAVEFCTCSAPWGYGDWPHRATCQYGRLKVTCADGRTFHVSMLAVAELGRLHLARLDRAEPVAESGDQLSLGGAA